MPRLWIKRSCTRKTQQRRPQTWSDDCTSSVCLGGVSGDGWANWAWVYVSRGCGRGKGLNHFFFVLLLSHISSFRLENLFPDRQRFHERDNLLKTTLMERPRSCKSYLIARLATCCDYLQRTLSPENNNLDLILRKLGAQHASYPTSLLTLIHSIFVVSFHCYHQIWPSIHCRFQCHLAQIQLWRDFYLLAFWWSISYTPIDSYIFLFSTNRIVSLEYSFVEIKC